MQCWIGELGGVFWMLKSSRRQQWELLNYWCSHSWFVCEGFLNWWFKWYLKWTPDSFCFVFGKIDCWCFKLQSRFEEEKNSETALLVVTVVFLLLLLLLLSLFEALNLELSFRIPWSEFWEEVVVLEVWCLSPDSNLVARRFQSCLRSIAQFGIEVVNLLAVCCQALSGACTDQGKSRLGIALGSWNFQRDFCWGIKAPA